MLKIIYLDQNKWIELSRAYYGKEKDKDTKKVCNTIIKASDSGKAIFPFSIVHLMETLNRADKLSRSRLAKFMVKLSKGYYILPFTWIIDLEVRNAIFKRIGRPTKDLRKIAVSKEFYTLIGKPTIKKEPKLSKEQINKLPKELKLRILDYPKHGKSISEAYLDWLQSTDGLLWLLERPDKPIQDESYLLRLEKARASEKEIKDKTLRKKVTMYKNITQIILPKVMKILINFNIPPQILFSKKPSKEEVMDFIKDIPTSFVFFTLTDIRNSQEGAVHPHDLNDIAAFSIAIPYCDTVVIERKFASIAKSAKLDKIYNTKILTSLKDLKL